MKKITFKSIKRWKKSILIKKVKFNSKSWTFDLCSISYRSFSIEFKLFDKIFSRFNWFHRDKLKSRFKFGLQNSIRSQFDHDIKWNVDLDQLDRLSLAEIVSECQANSLTAVSSTGVLARLSSEIGLFLVLSLVV